MEDCLKLEVSKFKVGLWIDEIFFHHFVVVLHYRVVNWEVSIVIRGVQLWLNFLHDIRFAFKAHCMFDGVTFVVLLAACSEKVV